MLTLNVHFSLHYHFTMTYLWSCIVGPRVYRIYGTPQSRPYVANALEKIGNKIIQGLKILYNIGLYSSPFIILSLYRWDLAGYLSIVKYGTSLGLMLVVALIIRGIGRRVNPTYITFLAALTEASSHKPPEQQSMVALRKYEFDFSAWPVNFDYWTDADSDEKKPRVFIDRSSNRSKGGLNKVIMLPCQLMAYVLTLLVGKWLVYPGCIQLLQLALDQYLQNGREKLICELSGTRSKVTTRDGNSIDTMLVDRREKKIYPNGNTLVVCCEGNAGFYEVGIMTTPLEAGYSVLGWNHPGFAASTGSPFPKQEQYAVDAVMQYAIHNAGFKQEDILIYGWSIGGYTSTWAAMNYPLIGGLVLDATFDDILPLAIPRMPACMSGIVTSAIRNHINLTPGDQLMRYPGPVTVIRRTRDEIITTDETQISSNCGNDLLVKLLKMRYPELVCTESTDALWEWLSLEPPMQGRLLNEWGVDSDFCATLLATYINEHSESYPLRIGEEMNHDDKAKLILYLASKYMVDYNSSHNNPLDPTFFRKPWRLITEFSYIQVD